MAITALALGFMHAEEDTRKLNLWNQVLVFYTMTFCHELDAEFTPSELTLAYLWQHGRFDVVQRAAQLHLQARLERMEHRDRLLLCQQHFPALPQSTRDYGADNKKVLRLPHGMGALLGLMHRTRRRSLSRCCWALWRPLTGRHSLPPWPKKLLVP